MNKGAAAALEEEEDWRHARCDCTTVRRVRRRPATAKAEASAAATAAATTFLVFLLLDIITVLAVPATGQEVVPASLPLLAAKDRIAKRSVAPRSLDNGEEDE